MIRIGETTAECPVCSGRGKTTVVKWGPFGNDETTVYQCRACAGTGRILQAVDSREEQP